MVVVTAAIAGLLGIGFQLNSPEITSEEYWLLGIYRVPTDRFVHAGPWANWEDVPDGYDYVVWLDGNVYWDNRWFSVMPGPPDIWLENENRERVGRIYVKQVETGYVPNYAEMFGVGIRSEDWKSASNGYIVVARNKKEVARLALVYSAEAVDFPDRSVVQILDSSVNFRLRESSAWAEIRLTAPGFGGSLASADDEGDLLIVVGQASFLPTADEHVNEVLSLLMSGQYIDTIELVNRPFLGAPMAVEVSGRVVHGTWKKTTLHVDVSSIDILPTAVPEEELVVPKQSLSFPGGSITLRGTSRRDVKDNYRHYDHQIGFSLDLRSSFTVDWSAFAHASDQVLVILAPGIGTSSEQDPGSAYYLPGESVLHIDKADELIEKCKHDGLGFDIDIYTVRSREVEDFSLQLKPTVRGF